MPDHSIKDQYIDQRQKALGPAEKTLRNLGFSREHNGNWIGEIFPENQNSAKVKIVFPSTFPDTLPKVYVTEHDRRLAHVDHEGKICIAPESGILLDVSRPDRIIEDVVERTKRVLSLTDSEIREEILKEYSAYWCKESSDVYSICRQNHASGPLFGLCDNQKKQKAVLASSKDVAFSVAQRMQGKYRSKIGCYFLKLNKVLFPPEFCTDWNLKEFLDLLAKYIEEKDYSQFVHWLSNQIFPIFLVISIPIVKEERVIVGIEINNLTKNVKKQINNGFRPGKMPPGVFKLRAGKTSLTRIPIKRLDSEFLLPRGGSSYSLISKVALLIGCGSVGSHCAQSLVHAGIGKLIIVDPEILTNENIYRHILGLSALGLPKAKAMARYLMSKFPTTEIIPKHDKVECLFTDNPEVMDDVDIIICATGEETIELRINALCEFIPRIHVWLEPFGLGGHCLVTGLNGKRGCYRCLFRYAEDGTFYNTTSLAKRGQNFQKSIGGCAGTYTPFGDIDAQLAASNATIEVVKILSGKEINPTLISWISSLEKFEHENFLLSNRGVELKNKRYVRIEDFFKRDCPHCKEKLNAIYTQ